MITSIHVYRTGNASAKLKCSDDTEVEITLPAEGLGDLTIEKRIELIMTRANHYLEVNCGNASLIITEEEQQTL